MTRYFTRPATRRGIAVLALAAIVSFLASRDVQQELRAPLAQLDNRLNYALFDFRARLLDERGQLAATIEAPVLRNNADTGVGSITEPQIYVRESGNDWQIESDSAVISADRQFVSLSGEVQVVRYNDQDSDAVTLDTRDMVLAVTPRTASTDSRVNIRHAGDQIAANGMFVDMINDQFELLNEVSAIYDTP